MKKCLMAFVMLFSILLCCSTPVYASTYTSVKDYMQKNNLPTNIYNEGFNHFMYKGVLSNGDASIYCFIYDKNFKAFLENSYYISLDNSTGYSGYYGLKRYNGTEWEHVTDGVLDSSQTRLCNIGGRDVRVMEGYITEATIYLGWKCETVFFQQTPLQPTPTEPTPTEPTPTGQTILTEITAEVEMTEVMAQVVGLIPLVVGFLICLVGFWKAYSILVQVLRRA